ncbi:MAG: hypothetical protein PHE89_07995 [Alphaproteobacteria bacterium]|nr:hypothetical protein [Alphaproteobacteria bacterium]
MKNSLQTLSRVQKWNIDEQRKILANFLTEEDKVEQEISRINQEYEIEKKFSEENPLLGDFGAYTKKYIRYRTRLEKRLQAIRDKIAELRDFITELFKEQKTYDIVDERRTQRQEEELAHKEQQMLDEIGTNNYIKANK